ncbi:MAG: hypothetical protein ACXACP_13505, partial [Candidatus Hodarchaeales archaeon]
MKNTNKKQRFRIFVFAVLLISIISISGFAAYAMQPVSIPTEVKEPLEILDYPKSFSLFPGETINFNFTVENLASITYFQEFDFIVNNTDYQKYVTFSNHNYSIPPGIHTLNAWFTISPNAPASNFVITINKKTEEPILPPSPDSNTNITLSSSLKLLAGGIEWAAQEGKAVLFVNWKDNYENHHNTDGVNWLYPIDADIDEYRTLITAALEYSRFRITYSGDIPVDLTSF